LAVQTSRDGVPRPIVFGTAAVTGNIIDRSAPKIVKKKERSGKGGPVTVTERVYMSYAIRVCEGPATSISRVWENEKLVYDATPGSTIVKDSTKFLTKVTFYMGEESQLPDPTLEAIHGVGSTPAHRGTCYAVWKDKDLTDFGGAIPQYLFEDNGESVFEPSAIYASVTFPGKGRATDIFRDGNGGIGIYYNPSGSNGLVVGGTFKRSLLNTALAEVSTTTITHQAGSPGDDRFWFRTGDKDGNIMGADDNFGYCEISDDGVYKARLEPYAGITAGWWYAEFSYTGNGAGGLLWIENGKIWHCNRQTNAGQQLSYWSSIPATGLVAATTNKATTFLTYNQIYCHLAENGTYYVYSDGDNQLYTWNIGTNTLTAVLSINLGGTFGMFAFAVHRGKLMALNQGPSAGAWRMSVYKLSDGSFINDVTGFTDPNTDCTKIIATDTAVYVKAGTKLYAVGVN
jgi:hypothetical protein